MKILIVEDDSSISDILKLGLESEAHVVDVADNGGDGSFLGRSYDYDAIILDYSLPTKNGLTVCREIRAKMKTTPIIFLSVENDTDIKIKAFDSGADDYMVKPFSLSELKARIRTVVRRKPIVQDESLHIHDLTLEPSFLSAVRDGRQIHLTKKEFALLEYMIRHKGVVLPRTTIMEHVWTADSDPFSNTVEAHIRNLRKKINIGKRPDLIANIPGHGYIMDMPENLTRFKK